MATTTAYYSLRKPAGTDTVNVLTDLDNNFDTIDTQIHDKETRVAALESEYNTLNTRTWGAWVDLTSYLYTTNWTAGTYQRYRTMNLGGATAVQIHLNGLTLKGTVTTASNGNFSPDVDIVQTFPAAATPDINQYIQFNMLTVVASGFLTNTGNMAISAGGASSFSYDNSHPLSLNLLFIKA